MNCVDFRIIKDGKDTGKIADLLVSYPESAGYELVLDKIWEKIEEKDNGEH